MRYLSQSRSSNSGRAASSLTPSDHVLSLILTIGGAKKVEVPAGAQYVVFSSTVDFFVFYGKEDVPVAFVPTTDIMDGTAPEMSPGMRTLEVDDVTHMSIIGIDAGQLTMAFYGG